MKSPHRSTATAHITRHTSHVTRHTSHVTRHTSHVSRLTSHVTRHTSHVTRLTSHVTRHTSHVTRHTHQAFYANHNRKRGALRKENMRCTSGLRFRPTGSVTIFFPLSDFRILSLSRRLPTSDLSFSSFDVVSMFVLPHAQEELSFHIVRLPMICHVH